MKKYISVILCFTLLICVKPIRASEINEVLPAGKNYLDLKNLKQRPYDIFASTIDPIYIASDQTYTLVMSYDYIGEYMDDVILEELEYEDLNGGSLSAVYQDDDENERIYVELMLDASIDLLNVPYLVNHNGGNYDVMLYQGTYEDFDGFEPYLSLDYQHEIYSSLSIDIDHLLTTSQINGLIKAYDRKHQEISYEIVSDSYQGHVTEPGFYEMRLVAMVNRVKKTLILNIEVYDSVAPVIEGPDTIYTTYGDMYTLDEILQMFTVTDNVDQLTWEDIDVITNDYQYADTIGGYRMEIGVIDSSNNKTRYQFIIEVIDETAPEIIGPDSLILYASDQPYTDTYILSQFDVHDDVDDSLSLSIVRNDYLSQTSPGIYEVELETSDQSENVTKRIIYIHVIDNEGPTFEVEEPIVLINTNEPLSNEEIEVLLKNHVIQLNSKIDNINVLYNEYENHEDKPGAYYIYYTYELDEEIHTSRVMVEVVESSRDIELWYTLFLVIPIGLGSYIFIKKKKKKNNA